VSADVAQRLNALMVNNENSYAGNGKITGVQIAAKTGTAEHGDDPKNLAPHVWYVAFAPAEAPQVAVAVLVEDGGDPNNLAATGGLVAAPIGRAVIAAALGKASR
jgi:peptidoglycan glycosyltransferase